MSPTRSAGLALALACALPACGGAAPLLHPAHVLPPGDVRAAVGLAAQATTGALSDDLSGARDRASRDPSVPGAAGTNADYARGTLVAASVAPGVSPIVSARVGLAGQYEGGITYSGRGVRLDARHAWSNKHTALSVGGGLSGAFLGQSGASGLRGVDLAALRAFGFDVPVIAGWRSDAGLYQAWVGARAGYDHATIEPISTEPTPPATANVLAADHVHAGGLVGVAIGLRHVHVALELDAAWHWLWGRFNATEARTSGLVLAPSTALSWDF